MTEPSASDLYLDSAAGPLAVILSEARHRVHYLVQYRALRTAQPPAYFMLAVAGWPRHSHSSASGNVCIFTLRSVCPALRAKTNW